MSEFNIDLSELTSAALRKIAEAIDIEVNGKLKEDIIRELNEMLEEKTDSKE